MSKEIIYINPVNQLKQLAKSCDVNFRHFMQALTRNLYTAQELGHKPSVYINSLIPKAVKLAYAVNEQKAKNERAASNK